MNDKIISDSEVRQIQIEILKQLDKVCKENNIQYFLSGGTMLGAIRHKGFIPWDDDIDVMMTLKNYKLFLKVWKDVNSFKIITPYYSWFISKRYTQMKEFYEYLKNLQPYLEFPSFPPKKLFSTAESTIIERKNSFEDLFSFVIQNIDILKYKKLKQFSFEIIIEVLEKIWNKEKDNNNALKMPGFNNVFNFMKI